MQRGSHMLTSYTPKRGETQRLELLTQTLFDQLMARKIYAQVSMSERDKCPLCGAVLQHLRLDDESYLPFDLGMWLCSKGTTGCLFPFCETDFQAYKTWRTGEQVDAGFFEPLDTIALRRHRRHTAVARQSARDAHSGSDSVVSSLKTPGKLEGGCGAVRGALAGVLVDGGEREDDAESGIVAATTSRPATGMAVDPLHRQLDRLLGSTSASVAATTSGVGAAGSKRPNSMSSTHSQRATMEFSSNHIESAEPFGMELDMEDTERTLCTPETPSQLVETGNGGISPMKPTETASGSWKPVVAASPHQHQPLVGNGSVPRAPLDQHFAPEEQVHSAAGTLSRVDVTPTPQVRSTAQSLEMAEKSLDVSAAADGQGVNTVMSQPRPLTPSFARAFLLDKKAQVIVTPTSDSSEHHRHSPSGIGDSTASVVATELTSHAEKAQETSSTNSTTHSNPASDSCVTASGIGPSESPSPVTVDSSSPPVPSSTTAESTASKECAADVNMEASGDSTSATATAGVATDIAVAAKAKKGASGKTARKNGSVNGAKTPMDAVGDGLPEGLTVSQKKRTSTTSDEGDLLNTGATDGAGDASFVRPADIDSSFGAEQKRRRHSSGADPNKKACPTRTAPRNWRQLFAYDTRHCATFAQAVPFEATLDDTPWADEMRHKMRKKGAAAAAPRRRTRSGGSGGTGHCGNKKTFSSFTCGICKRRE